MYQHLKLSDLPLFKTTIFIYIFVNIKTLSLKVENNYINDRSTMIRNFEIVVMWYTNRTYYTIISNHYSLINNIQSRGVFNLNYTINIIQ